MLVLLCCLVLFLHVHATLFEGFFLQSTRSEIISICPTVIDESRTSCTVRSQVVFTDPFDVRALQVMYGALSNVSEMASKNDQAFVLPQGDIGPIAATHNVSQLFPVATVYISPPKNDYLGKN